MEGTSQKVDEYMRTWIHWRTSGGKAESGSCADWPRRLGGAWEPGESLGEAEQTLGAAGAQIVDPASRSPEDSSPGLEGSSQ
ncbi:Hypothetical predicted protein [Marmota monax]|uniref:Uncharacterized protein n=1 Tax=Marmota monax TaxID=9995 RepID=A0A5E4AAU4_MARMO|nr:Hypothetical predicted protein [Marmota monax]